MRAICIILAVFLAGCATQKQWAATGGSRADGTVKLSYEYTEFEAPQITAAQGTPLAASRCRAWGYTGAEPFGGVSRICNQLGGFGGCGRWMVTAEYQCVSGGSVAPLAAPVQQSAPEPIATGATPAPALAPSTPASSAYAPPPKELPKNDYTAGKLARTLGCGAPMLLSMSSTTETFQTACPGGQSKIIQCEFTNCRVMQ